MRIISGSLGGRKFDAPKGHRTHPMSEKVRGGLFSALGDIAGLGVLDAFAGSGALSFEALSRGAKHALAIDIDRSAINTVVNSAKRLGIGGRIKAVRANAGGWSDNNPGAKFDIIICDPPFDKIKLPLLEKLAAHLDAGGTFIANIPGSMEPPALKTLKIVKAKNYGDSTLVYYKRETT